MAKTKEQKKELLELYRDILKDNPNYILVNTDGVSMSEITELKKELRETDAQFHILKNTLFRIAAGENEQPTKIQELTQATGIIVAGDDIAAAAKALKNIQTDHEVMETRYGVVFGDVAEPETIKELADIPPREVLLAKLAGSLNAPLSGFAQVISGNVRDFVYALSEIQKTKEA